MKRIPGAPDGAVHIAGSTLYLPGLTNSGYVDGLMIDTGPDESPYEFASADRLAITHGHADHFACGAYLRKRGATVVAARDDAALVENPDINIRGMFSWAKPGDILVSKLFRGTPCKVDALVEQWRDKRATPVSLPGHTLGHTGFLTADKVLFTGDALYLEALWARHPLPYAIDPDLVASSLRSLREIDFDWLVPGHGELVDRATAEKDIEFHLRQIAEIEASILEGLVTPRTTEECIAMVSAARGLSDNPAQYWLAVTTVKGYLGDLLGRGLLEFSVVDHAGVWHTAE
jgi:glyoxylase-like metal-dependent hydrolase (beta-lactamase superfamily II)